MYAHYGGPVLKSVCDANESFFFFTQTILYFKIHQNVPVRKTLCSYLIKSACVHLILMRTSKFPLVTI